MQVQLNLVTVARDDIGNIAIVNEYAYAAENSKVHQKTTVIINLSPPERSVTICHWKPPP